MTLGTRDPAEAKERFDKYLPSLLKRIKDGHLKSGSFNALCDYYVGKGGDDREWLNQTRNRQILTPFQAVCNAGARRRPPLCAPRLFIKFSYDKPAVIDAPEWWIKWAVQSAAAEGQTRLGLLMLYMTTTAVRISEALRIEWGDVDLDNGYIHIRRTKNGHPWRTKIIPVLARQLATMSKDDKMVFGFATRDEVRRAIEDLCAKHEKPVYTSHQFGRHAFARRLLVDKGASLLMVKEAGGWRSLQVVVDNYGHLEQTHADQMVVDAAEGFEVDALIEQMAPILVDITAA